MNRTLDVAICADARAALEASDRGRRTRAVAAAAVARPRARPARRTGKRRLAQYAADTEAAQCIRRRSFAN